MLGGERKANLTCGLGIETEEQSVFVTREFDLGACYTCEKVQGCWRDE